MAIEITDSVIDDADAYFTNRLESSSWTNANETTKRSSLVTAGTILNSMDWAGSPQGAVYPFPRYLPNSNVATTPIRILQALYELALHLLQNPSVLASEESVDTLVLGPLKMEHIKPVDLIPRIVTRLISDYTLGGSVGGATWWRAN